MAKTLRTLSDKDLLSQIHMLRKREHLAGIDILLHLNEVEYRRLHLKLGYSSLFDYCTNHLRYSSAAAGRRVQVARCVRRHPEVRDRLLTHEVNLSTVSLVASILTDDNKTELLDLIRNRSQREVEAIASRYRPPIQMRDRVKPVRVRVQQPVPRETQSSSLTKKDNRISVSPYSRSGSDIMLTKKAAPPTSAVRVEEKLLVQFLASKEFMAKYARARALLSQRLREASFENVLDAIVSDFLERNCPDRKKARREKQKPRTKRIDKKGSGAGKSEPKRAAKSPPKNARRIPAVVRDEVYTRDKGRCTYVGKNGRQCGSTHALQIDHVEPVARGGPSAIGNLRLLCAEHNRLAAAELFGERFMAGYPRRE